MASSRNLFIFLIASYLHLPSMSLDCVPTLEFEYLLSIPVFIFGKSLIIWFFTLFLHLFLVTVCTLCFDELLKVSLWLKLDGTLLGAWLFLGGPFIACPLTQEELVVTIMSWWRTWPEVGVKHQWDGALPTARWEKRGLFICLLIYGPLFCYSLKGYVKTNTLKLDSFPHLFYNFFSLRQDNNKLG